MILDLRGKMDILICIILTRLAFSREICAQKRIFLYYFNAPCVFTRNLRANLDLDLDFELD